MEEIQIRTSEEGWFTQLARAYKQKTPVFLVDDAKVGIDPAVESLAAMGLKAKLTPREWSAVSVAVGLSAAGAAMVVLAFLDPEPTSKLGLLVGGGAVCVLTGGLTAVRILTKMRPPNVQIGPSGMKIFWT
jgi:hypothetical protein